MASSVTVSLLRELFRHFQDFRALYETEGIDVLEVPDGRSFSLCDLEYLYSKLPYLPPRQHQAIELCLVQNHKESDAAVMMGVSPTNPVAMYATSGLEKLVSMIEAGECPRFSFNGEAVASKKGVKSSAR